MQHKIAEIVMLVCWAWGGHDSIKPMHVTNDPVFKANATSTAVTTPQFSTGHRLLLMVGLLVGFALRLYRLGSESLWYDETVSVVLARKSIPDLIAHTAGDIHPPGYYLLLHGWQALVHPTLGHGLELLFAWPSLFCGLLIVALLFTLGRQLLDPTTALVALWLAAINPFHIWYSQEVRMYTLGALLGLLCLWAVVKWRHCAQQRPSQAGWRWLLLYALVGALGLYTLYYLLFVLMVLNLIAVLDLVRTRPTGGQPVWRQAAHWLLAQFGVLLLWSPWLGNFWRQATEPPVPPWRVAWSSTTALVAAVGEGLSALISGQSTVKPTSALWLVVVVVLLLYLGYANKKSQRPALVLLGVYVFLPLTLLYLITYFVTPLYHVRYLFTYAPPFLLLVAAAIVTVGRRQQGLSVLLVLALCLVNGLSLQRFWFADEFRRDDHRAAVAQLAQSWRPGDLILVNAGWAYTALETYWPTTLTGVDAALPPPLGETVRLHDYAQNMALKKSAPRQVPFLVRTGSLDGPASLGWGDPQSDFFAIDGATATAALLTLSQHYGRNWHYRLYDTVSDPQGQLRAWLAANSQLLLDQAIPGRDYLKLQLYQSNHGMPTAVTAQLFTPDTVRFGNALQLETFSHNPPTVAAGSTLYRQSRWSLPAADKKRPTTLSFSLRLYTEDGVLLAQQDETPNPAVTTWSTTSPTDWTLALPIPVDTPPGNAQLQLIVYDQADGVALALGQGEQRLVLGEVTVTTATTIPIVNTRLARFDYIDLIQATVTPAATVDTGISVTLVWLPQPSTYRDTYLTRLTLHDEAGNVLQRWEDALGGWRYPSGTWPPLLPVRHDQQLALAPTTPAGTYRLTVAVQRQSDGSLIPATRGWWQQADEFVLGTVVVP